jgi:hypothetical protein
MTTYIIGVTSSAYWDFEISSHEGTYAEAMEIAEQIEAVGILNRTEQDIQNGYKRIWASIGNIQDTTDGDFQISFTRIWVDPSS